MLLTMVAIGYPALLFVGAHAWLLWYGFNGQGPLAYLSYLMQQLALVALYALIDARLKHPKARFLLASLAALYLAFIHLDALLIDVVGLSSHRAAVMFAAGGSSTLAEIGLRPTRLLLMLTAVFGLCALGGLAHRWLDRFRVELAPSQARFAWAACAAMPLLFVAEQIVSRDRDRYIYRSIELPGYLQIYETATRSHHVKLQSPADTVARHSALAEIGPAKNPKHVLFLLLESVRADAIEPQIAPALAKLAESSLEYTNAYTESIFTPLSWNVLLLDRPVHMFMWPRNMLAPRAPGSWPLGVLRQAGYRIWVSSSTDLEYGHFLPFMLGESDLIDRLNIIRAPELERWQRDDRAASDLIRWIDSSAFDEPTFMLLQLDSTHWTYEFPEDAAVVKPFSERLTMPVPLTTVDEFTLLFHRYQNCVHHVDRKIDEVLSALRSRGIEDDTAIVVVSDHGEGFSPGTQGHATLCEETTRIPLLLKLPGVEPQKIDELVSFRNVFPTLFDYLQIEAVEGLMLGRSILPPLEGESEILMFSPDGRRADLRLSDGRRIQFNVVMREDHASFTPVGLVPRGVDWQAMIDARMRFNVGVPVLARPGTVSAEGSVTAPSG